MRPISVRVDEHTYARFKEIARVEGKPVAALIREAMERFSSDRPSENRRSILDINPHDCGPSLQEWTREETFDEMIGLDEGRVGD